MSIKLAPGIGGVERNIGSWDAIFDRKMGRQESYFDIPRRDQIGGIGCVAKGCGNV
jgi:hypothetical protein